MVLCTVSSAAKQLPLQSVATIKHSTLIIQKIAIQMFHLGKSLTEITANSIRSFLSMLEMCLYTE